MENEYAGQGGSYAVGEDGRRKLIERTEQSPPAPRAPATPEAPAAPDQPASAGFLSPVIPATPADNSTLNPEKP